MQNDSSLKHLFWGNYVRIMCFMSSRLASVSTSHYNKYPKILYTNLFDKISYANSADPDQTSSEGAA